MSFSSSVTHNPFSLKWCFDGFLMTFEFWNNAKQWAALRGFINAFTVKAAVNHFYTIIFQNTSHKIHDRYHWNRRREKSHLSPWQPWACKQQNLIWACIRICRFLFSILSGAATGHKVKSLIAPTYTCVCVFLLPRCHGRVRAQNWSALSPDCTSSQRGHGETGVLRSWEVSTATS